MEILQKFLDNIPNLLPSATAITITIIVILAARGLLKWRASKYPGFHFRYQIIMVFIFFICLLFVILTLPINDTKIVQLLSLLGLLLSAAIALSATTFLGNILAGFMLRVVKNFRPGDFISVNEHFGKVSERGLFHVEIQTEESDLTTLPNMYLVTNPVKVIRSSGTLITATVSLGYDVPSGQVKEALLNAARDSSLEDPFVHVKKLGDFSIIYQVAGVLKEVKSIISTRAKLRENMLHNLHKSKIEIVSPTFMNQRVLPLDQQFIPKSTPKKITPEKTDIPESVIFDKADEAESLERLKERQVKINSEISKLKDSLSDTFDEASHKSIKDRIKQLKTSRDHLLSYITEREKDEK